MNPLPQLPAEETLNKREIRKEMNLTVETALISEELADGSETTRLTWLKSTKGEDRKPLKLPIRIFGSFCITVVLAAAVPNDVVIAPQSNLKNNTSKTLALDCFSQMKKKKNQCTLVRFSERDEREMDDENETRENKAQNRYAPPNIYPTKYQSDPC